MKQRTDARAARAQNGCMDTQTILFVACVLFGLAAAGGIVMALIRVGAHNNPPHWIAMLHGFIAAAGVTLLAYVTIFAHVPDMAPPASTWIRALPHAPRSMPRLSMSSFTNTMS